MDSQLFDTERTIKRVVLPGQSFPMIRKGAMQAAKQEGRAIKSGEIETKMPGDVVEFSQVEWNSIPEPTKLKFGYISNSEAQALAISRKQEDIEIWIDKVDKKRDELQSLESSVERSYKAGLEQIRQMKADLIYLEAELSRVSKAKDMILTEAKAETAGFSEEAQSVLHN